MSNVQVLLDTNLSKKYINNVVSFGADPTGTTDSTSAIRAAIATGLTVYLPAGTYIITDTLVLNSGQLMKGDGRTVTNIKVNSATFNMSASQVIRLGSAETGAGLADIGIMFVQADCTRANLIQYPTAINAQGASRFQINRVRVNGGWIGLDATSNGAGGSFLDCFECSSFYRGVICDASYDFFHVGTVEFWPFGLDSAMQNIYFDGNTTGMEIGRVDGFTCKSYTTYGTQLHFNSNAGTNGIAYNFGILDLDGDHANLNVDAGIIQVGVMYSTKSSAPTDIPVNIKGGNVTIGMLSLASGMSSSSIIVSGGVLTVNSGNILAQAPNTTFLSVTGGIVKINNLNVIPSNNTTTVPIISQTGGSLQLTNIMFTSSGSGTAISFGADSILNSIANANLNGWGCAFSPTFNLGTYSVTTGILSDLFTHRNKLINGIFKIDQRNQGANATSSSGYGPDRWYTAFTQSSKVQITQATVTNSAFPQFSSVLAITNPSSYTAVSSDQFCFGQPIEGINISDLAWGTSSAKPITISFYALSVIPGPFAVSIRNSAKTMSYVTYVTQPTNTWTRFTITVPGPTSGTWLTTAGNIGLTLSFDLGSGSTFQVPSLNAWVTSGTGNFTSFNGNVSFVGAAANSTMYITGIQLEAGNTASSFELVPYDIDLVRCQRYYQVYGKNQYSKLGIAVATSATAACLPLLLPVKMQKIPTLNLVGSSFVLNGSTSLNVTPSLDQATTSLVSLNLAGSGMTAGYSYALQFNDSVSAIALVSELTP